MTVLVVDPFSSGSEYEPLLRKAGLTTYLLQTDASIHAGLAPAKDSSLMQFSEDFGGDLTQLYKWVVAHDVRTVLTGTESGVAVAEALKFALETGSVPEGGSSSRYLSSRYDKYQMLVTSREAGVDVGRFIEVTDLQEGSIHNYSAVFDEDESVVVKPSISAGSVDVTIANSYQETLTKCQQLLSKTNLFGQPQVPVLIQQLHSGKEFIVDTVSFGGSHQVLAVSSYDKHQISSGYFVYDRIQWIAPDNDVYPRVVQYAQDILNALDYADGSAHIEIMLTNNGPFLIDIGFRPHGAGHPMKTLELTGNSQLHQEVYNALVREGEKAYSFQEYSLSAYGCIEFFSIPKPAETVAEFDFNDIKGMRQVKEFTSNLKEDMRYPQTRTLLDSLDLGLCFLVGSSPAEVQDVGAEVRKRFARAFK